MFLSGQVDEGDGIRPRFDFSRYLTPGAGPAEAGVHAVLAHGALRGTETQLGALRRGDQRGCMCNSGGEKNAFKWFMITNTALPLTLQLPAL